MTPNRLREDTLSELQAAKREAQRIRDQIAYYRARLTHFEAQLLRADKRIIAALAQAQGGFIQPKA